mmetsp:Transcript_14193/g.28590  ORF Transcript_14193/g.28590 Transcript_14193/m.28590 type:complete len:88 (-) Transcript_14193:103-366(-)|eukprot:CAMPEP_0113823434 /NCGR_PEP_ID=MMETSP0328-20130328/2740_1 /TAXON_ID=39455 /ORGANISM="Alexandrium minutum" /LENGTH=87 /DNA_ID=CAMNT_0000791373 /DNA_START=108 /DNA_END=371 /DNA_ORIENTATION=+ /assembly_acc=CAM_ASM_000350
MPVYVVVGEDEDNTTEEWQTIVRQQSERDRREGIKTDLSERLSAMQSVSLADLAPDGGEGRPTSVPEVVPQLETALRTQVAPWAADF